MFEEGVQLVGVEVVLVPDDGDVVEEVEEPDIDPEVVLHGGPFGAVLLGFVVVFGVVVVVPLEFVVPGLVVIVPFGFVVVLGVVVVVPLGLVVLGDVVVLGCVVVGDVVEGAWVLGVVVPGVGVAV